MYKFTGALLALALLALFASCGGGGTNASPGTGDGDPLPGLVGNIDAPPAASDLPVAHKTEGVWPDAPLGTTADYNTQPAAGVVAGHSASKALSALPVGQPYAILGATITLAGTEAASVDWDATGLTFQEGTKVSLWVKYEVAPSFTFIRKWKIPETGLDYSETIVESTGGVYTVHFEYSLPFVDGTANISAVYTSSLTMPKQGSAVIIVDPGITEGSVPFIITKVPTDPYTYSTEEAQMGWEDLITNSDYDYNDLVTRMRVTERRRRSDNKLVQIDLYLKGIARGAGYDHGWQFNMDGAFPGSSAMAYIEQYYATGAPHGSQRIWTSQNGTSIPVFVSSKEALPAPPESYATNTVKGSTFIDGDYAYVTIMFDTPLAVGTYTPMPYKPQLRVYANDGSVYTIGLWTRRGDPVDSNHRPLAFIIPDNYAPPMEGRYIWYGYPRFTNWVAWVNDLTKPDSAQPKFWDDTPVWKTGTTYNVFQRSLFK
jgi:LruC domain-containing protein